MNGSGSGPLGLLLMIAPLAAIPVFAIVGVPQFAPVSASQSEEEEVVEWADTANRNSRPPVDTAPKGRPADDLFLPVTGSAPRPTTTSSGAVASQHEPGPQSAASRWLPPADALDQWEVRPDSAEAADQLRMPPQVESAGAIPRGRSRGLEFSPEVDDDRLVSMEGFDPDLLKPDGRAATLATATRSAKDAPLMAAEGTRSRGRQRSAITQTEGVSRSELISQSTAEQAGWQEAARRLKELGIRKHRLESQIEEQTFLFLCVFASPDNPQIVRRFEAEAETPLEAVQLVLQQIDEWNNRESRGSQRPSIADDDR